MRSGVGACESNLGRLHGLFGADSRTVGDSIECRGRIPRDHPDLNLDGHLSSTRFVDLLTPHARVAELGQLSRLQLVATGEGRWHYRVAQNTGLDGERQPTPPYTKDVPSQAGYLPFGGNGEQWRASRKAYKPLNRHTPGQYKKDRPHANITSNRLSKPLYEDKLRGCRG